MSKLNRLFLSRITLVAAITLSAILLLTQIHASELAKERNDLSSTNFELAYISSQNRQLLSDIRALRQMPYVEHLARVEYGLTSKGQKEYSIIFPNNTHSANGIGQPRISPSQLVEGDTSALTGSQFLSNQTTGVAKANSPSILGRMLNQIEFWNWAF